MEDTIPKVKSTREMGKTVDFDLKGIDSRKNTPDLDWDYESRTLASKWEWEKEELKKGNKSTRTTSMPKEGGMLPPSFEETGIPEEFFCENCLSMHAPRVCPCPICSQLGHMIADCPQGVIFSRDRVLFQSNWEEL